MNAATLVGREKELARLDDLLEETGREGFRVLAVGGEPGIGKTSLLDQLAARGDEDGWLVLRGSAAEFETELPLAPVIDCFDAYLQALDPRTTNRFDEDTLTELAGIFPGLSSYRERSATPIVSSERFRSYHAIRKLVEDLGTRQNLLVVLDDCQWADQASLELISHLMRRPPDAPVLVAAGYRANRIHPVMEADLNAGVSRGLVTRMDVEPLGPEESKALAGVKSETERDRLYSETGGNPFYILELSKAMDGAEPAPNSMVPPAVGAAISSEIASVSARAKSFLDASAVAGDPFDIDLAGSISGLGDEDAIDALDELDRIGIIRPTEIPRRFAFRHPLVRAAVYESTPAGARLRLHEGAAKALAAAGAPAIELAKHVELSARPGDLESAEVLVTAAEATMAQAPAIALSWFLAARRIAPNEREALAMRNLGGLAAAAAACGRADDALAALTECIELLGDENLPVRITLIAACASLERLKGEHDRSARRLMDALEEVGDPASEAGVELTLQLANNSLFRMDVEEMDRWSRPALEDARAIGEPKLLATALATRAICCAFSGDMKVAMDCRDESAAIVDAMDDEELSHNVDTINRLCAAELYLERFPESVAHAEQGLEAARRTGQAQAFFLLYPCLGQATCVTADLDRSASLLDAGVEAARLARNGQGLVWALMARANTAIATGDLDLARASIEESDALPVTKNQGLIGGWSGAVTANVLVELGRHQDALETLRDRCGGEELPGIPSTWRIRYLALQASILLRLDRPDEARRFVELAESQADLYDRPLARSYADRGRAELELATGDPAAAETAAARAVAEVDLETAPIEAALCRLWLGRAQGAAGKKDDALETLAEAAGIFGKYQSGRYLKATEREQRALGQRVNRRTKGGQGETGIEALTERELEVARLVTDRHTNREIAETLFLSQKTVETHLRNIFMKLGVKSRVETARMLEKSG